MDTEKESDDSGNLLTPETTSNDEHQKEWRRISTEGSSDKDNDWQAQQQKNEKNKGKE